MDVDKLAQEIQNALGQKGAVSDKNKSLAKAIVAEVKTALCIFPPNMITGIAPSSGGPLQNGAAANGLILGLTGAAFAASIAADLGEGPPTPEVIGLGVSFSTHLMTGLVSIRAGGVTGVCANSPTSPGPFTGQGSKGQVSGLDGSALATLIAPTQGGSSSPQLKAMCTAIVKHIQTNCEVALTGCVAVASAAGGPIAGGTNAAGTFS